jgi:hypothetical protein
MRVVHTALRLASMVSPAFIQREPQIIIPGEPGVAVHVNGVNASWEVVEGEFGLDRPGPIAPTVIYRPLIAEVPAANLPGYKRPGYGRYEVIPLPNQ